jgi:hypothetical protein
MQWLRALASEWGEEAAAAAAGALAAAEAEEVDGAFLRDNGAADGPELWERLGFEPDRAAEVARRLAALDASAIPEGTPPAPAKVAKAPAQLAVLVRWLPSLHEAAWRAVVARAVAAPVLQDEGSPGLLDPPTTALLQQCGIPEAEHLAVVEQCTFVRMQALKTGVSSSALAARLRPLGFTHEHIDVLTQAIGGASPRTIRGDAATADTVVAGVEEPSPLSDEDEEEDEEEQDYDMYLEGSPEWTKLKLTHLAAKSLKVLLRCAAQHLVGVDLEKAALDQVEEVLEEHEVEAEHQPPLLQMLCAPWLLVAALQRGIWPMAASFDWGEVSPLCTCACRGIEGGWPRDRARALRSAPLPADDQAESEAGEGEEEAAAAAAAVYPPGKGHPKLIASAARWYRTQLAQRGGGGGGAGGGPAMPLSTRSGLLEMDEGGAVFNPRWLELRAVGLEVYPSEEDAINGEKGAEFSLVPMALIVDGRGKKDAVPKKLRAARPHLLAVRAVARAGGRLGKKQTNKKERRWWRGGGLMRGLGGRFGSPMP